MRRNKRAEKEALKWEVNGKEEKASNSTMRNEVGKE